MLERWMIQMPMRVWMLAVVLLLVVQLLVVWQPLVVQSIHGQELVVQPLVGMWFLWKLLVAFWGCQPRGLGRYRPVVHHCEHPQGDLVLLVWLVVSSPYFATSRWLWHLN